MTGNIANHIRIAVFLLLAVSSKAAAMQTLNITQDMGMIALGTYTDYIKNPQADLRFEDLQSPDLEWLQSSRGSFNFGFTSSVYWFRIHVANNSTVPLEWFLEIDYPLLDEIDFYIPDTKGGFAHIQTGDHLPFSQRHVVDRNFVFRLLESPGTRTYYFRIHTTSSLNFTPTAWSPDGFVQRLNNQIPAFWIYNGIMVIMGFYNLFLYLSVKERSYLYYVLFIASWEMFSLALNGFAFQFFWPNSIWWANNCIPFLMCNILLWLCQFEREYAQTHVVSPRTDRLLLFGVIIPIFIWMSLTLFLPYSVSIRVSTAVTIWGISIFFSVGVALFIKGSRPARYLIISFTVVFIGALLYSLKTFGVLPTNPVTNWSLQIGAVGVVLFLSLGLADKINTMKDDLFLLNEELEKRVKERTLQLENTNKALKDSLDELKIAQKQLVQSEKMAALGGLVAGVAHEISTPLSVGITAASFLEDRTTAFVQRYDQGAVEPTLLQKYVTIAAESSNMILNNLNRAAELVKSFKQVAVDQTVEDLRKFHVKTYIQELLVSLRPHLKKGRQTISFVCPDDLQLISFPGALSQIITNLVMNSLIHGFEDKEEGKIYLEFRPEGDKVALIYSDDGKGMDQETLGKIFDPFFTTKRSHGGTGLGMHILYNLVTQTLGGQMECTSTPGEGVIFIIQLPVNRGHAFAETGFTTL